MGDVGSSAAGQSQVCVWLRDGFSESRHIAKRRVFSLCGICRASRRVHGDARERRKRFAVEVHRLSHASSVGKTRDMYNEEIRRTEHGFDLQFAAPAGSCPPKGSSGAQGVLDL